MIENGIYLLYEGFNLLNLEKWGQIKENDYKGLNNEIKSIIRVKQIHEI